MGLKDEKTRFVKYSTDGGRIFKKLEISSEPIKLYAITVKETPHLKKFIITAKTPTGYQDKAQIISVDFSNLHERDCLHDKENKEKSDYEEWIPYTAFENGCVDGRKVVMVRKKPSKNCFNPENFTLFYIKEYCKCTDEDYHCDFGYKRNSYDYCVWDNEVEKSQY